MPLFGLICADLLFAVQSHSYISRGTRLFGVCATYVEPRTHPWDELVCCQLSKSADPTTLKVHKPLQHHALHRDMTE